MSCLVLDFIGNQRREFRFDTRLSALFGGTRKQALDQLESGITSLPGNCYFHLDKESQKLILAHLKTNCATPTAQSFKNSQIWLTRSAMPFTYRVSERISL